jgi:hypothetical protein
MSNQELTERYQEHAVAMGKLMREAGDHISANAQLDLAPVALVEEITLIGLMLTEARYHAERMAVIAKLLGHAS